MTRYVLLVVLTTILVPIAFAQEPFSQRPLPEKDMEHEVHMRNMQLEQWEHEAQIDFVRKSRQLELKKQHMALQQHEAEMDFNQQMRDIELQKHRLALKNQQQHRKHPAGVGHKDQGGMFLLLAICFIVNILVAVWVYQDLRRRNTGSGIWIVIALLTGLLGVLVYAVVRLGDSRQTQ